MEKKKILFDDYDQVERLEIHFKEGKECLDQKATFFRLIKSGKQGLADQNKNKILPAEYDQVEIIYDHILRDYGAWYSYGDFFMKLIKSGKAGLANERGEILLANQYDSIEIVPKFHMGKRFFMVSKNGKKGLVSSDDEISIPIIYDEIENIYTLFDEAMEENTFIVTKNNKKGIVTVDNEIIIPIIYEHLMDSSYYRDIYVAEPMDYYVFEEDGKQGMIDRGNRVIIPAIYDKVGGHEAGEMVTIGGYIYIRVIKDKQVGYDNVKNERVIPSLYDDIIPVDRNRHCYGVNQNRFSLHRGYEEQFIVSKDQKKGLINLKNEILIPIVYDSLDYLELGEGLSEEVFFVVEEEEKKGLLNRHGDFVLPISYDKIEGIDIEEYTLYKFRGWQDRKEEAVEIRVDRL